MTDADRAAVLKLRVSPEQMAFVDPLAETLIAYASHRENFVMEADTAIVGFFQIDSTPGVQPIKDNLSLHEVQVDVAHQGRGYGKQFLALLPSFLKQQYPDWPSVCLTVNCRNTSAHRLYERGGFTDTGELYLEGRSGPQHIMVMALK